MCLQAAELQGSSSGQRTALLRSLWPCLTREAVGMTTRRRRRAPVPQSAFTGFRFPPDVIVLAVRWSLRFGLPYRDVEELLAERGVEVDQVTIDRWSCASHRGWLTPPAHVGTPWEIAGS